MTGVAQVGTVAGAVTKKDADDILRKYATARSGQLSLSPGQAQALHEAGALADPDVDTVDARAILDWLVASVSLVYEVDVPAAARHVYLLGRISGRRHRDPGMLALMEAGWRRYEDGSWREPPDVALLGQVAVARGFGAEVKAILELRQLSATWLAEENIGVSRQRLGRVLSTDKTMPVEQYLAICESLGLSPDTYATLGPHTQKLQPKVGP